jgi:predicted RNA-binding Zn-ribbon protein involved in translation (DUF1610 family)
VRKNLDIRYAADKLIVGVLMDARREGGTMDCASCKVQISPSFGHAIKKNECPACGKSIMDEESLAMMEDLSGFILGAVRLRAETVEALVLGLVARYEISLRSGASVPVKASEQARVQRPKAVAKLPHEDDEEAEDGNIVPLADLVDPDGPPISDEERERIMTERVAARYNMMPKETSMAGESAAARLAAMAGGVNAKAMSDKELLTSPVLEALHARRQAVQQANMEAGLSKVSRAKAPGEG